MPRDDLPNETGLGLSEAHSLRCWVRLLTAGVPIRGVAGAGIDLAGGIPGSAGISPAAGHREISWLVYFAVSHSGVHARHLSAHGAARLPPIVASDLAPVLGEHRRGNGGDKKYCGAERYDFGHL
jgi:hypothetical protein